MRSIASKILLILALAYSLVYVFVGFGNQMDPFFWLNKYASLDSGWMTYGTVLTGHLWLLLTGKSILSLRILSWLCTVMALALPYLCLLSKQQKRDNLHWLAVTYLLMGYGTFQEFSAGTLSVLLFAVLIVLYEQRRYTWLGLTMGFAILARFPNVLALPILLLGLCSLAWQEHWKGKRLLTGIGQILIGTALVWGLGYLLWHFTSTQTLTAQMGNHTMRKMLSYLCNLSFYQFHLHQWYNQNFHILVCFLIILLALYKSHIIHHTSYLVAMLLLATLPLGSDTGWLKLFPGMLCLLPWLMGQEQAQDSRKLLPLREVGWVFFLCGGIYTEFLCTTNAIGNRNLLRCDTWSQTPPMRGILIQRNQEERLQHITADYTRLHRQAQVYVLGQDIHLMRALTGAPAPYHNEFWSNIYDKVYTRWYLPLIEKEQPIFMISDTPCFILDKKKQFLHESRFEHTLLQHGYRRLDRSKYKYMIYLPPCKP